MIHSCDRRGLALGPGANGARASFKFPMVPDKSVDPGPTGRGRRF